MIEFDFQKNALDDRINLLFNAIGNHFGIKKQELMSDSRKQKIVYSRHVFILICFTYYSMKHWEISQTIGRDRSTVNHSCQTATLLIEYDENYKLNYNRVIHEIKRHEKKHIGPTA